jgi:peptide deformylase
MPVPAFDGASGQPLTGQVGGFTASTFQSELKQLDGTTA